MNNPFIDSFISRVDVGNFRISNFTKIIFFCGGPWSIAPIMESMSARDFLLKKTSEQNAELFDRFYFENAMGKWLEGGHYVDLHTFEQHISEICSVVFLIAESPGSYSELGSFVTVPTIVEKLYVVTNTSMDNDETYISLGPVKFLRGVKEGDETRVRSYEWGSAFRTGHPPTVNSTDLEGIWKDIINNLIQFDENSQSEKSFSDKIDGHVSLFILDIIDLYGACKFREISGFLNKIIDHIDEATLKKHLFLLKNLELVKAHRHGTDYFVSQSKLPHISYAFIPKTDSEVKDRLRLKQSIRKWFKENDDVRFEVIRRHVIGGSNE